MIVTIDGKLQHLKELDFIERQLYGILSPEKFLNDLIAFVKNQSGIDLSKEFLSYDEMKIVDDYVNNYFSVLTEGAKIYFVRAYLIGKLLSESDLEGKVFNFGIQQISKMPKFIQEAIERYKLSIEEGHALENAVERGAMLITNTAGNTQQQVKDALVQTIQQRGGLGSFENKIKEMLKEGGELNRDWKRVAISETNNAFANGYISAMNEGEYVIGISMPDACPHCKDLLHLKVYQVLKEAPKVDYSQLSGEEYLKQAELWEKYIWEGKNNFGRSTSLRKRINKDIGNKEDNLVYREHHELSMPVIPLHPNCRCRWVAFNPELQYVENGEIKLKVENPEAHAKWYKENIE